jgi:hypothetical protein
VSQAETNEDAIAEVARTRAHIAVVSASGAMDRWWETLAGPNAPKIFAKLPFIDIPNRPADLPAYVIGPPLQDSHSPDIQVFALQDAPKLQSSIASHGGVIAGQSGSELLVELPVAVALDDIGAEIGTTIQNARQVGAFFQPIRYIAERVA